jgi:hypothetical protein
MSAIHAHPAIIACTRARCLRLAILQVTIPPRAATGLAHRLAALLRTDRCFLGERVLLRVILVIAHSTEKLVQQTCLSFLLVLHCLVTLPLGEVSLLVPLDLPSRRRWRLRSSVRVPGLHHARKRRRSRRRLPAERWLTSG